MKKHEIIEMFAQCHAALEAVTDRVGCDFATAKLLCECENVLNEINAPKSKAAAIMNGLALVH